MNITEQFLSNLPKKPYATDDLKYGIKITPQSAAIRKKYIQHNHPDWLTCLVFDIDKNAYNILEDSRAKPNLAIFNRKNLDSAHFIYLLKTPVNTGSNGRLKPIRYVQAIEDSLAHYLQADPDYVGLLTKNPKHAQHLTHEPNSQPWELGHLSDFLDFSQTKKKREVSAHGRHCIIFDRLRFKAYEIVEEYRKAGAFELFKRVLMSYAEENNNFTNLPQLPYSSIKATVKSVSKWTWDNYTGETKKRGRDSGLNQFLTDPKDKQALAAIKTNEQRREATEAKIKAAVKHLQAKGAKTTQKAVAELSGLHKNTVQKYRHLLD